MPTKARIENNTVRELLTIDPFPPFHESLVWVDCDDTVKEGWIYDGSVFSAPVQPIIPINQQIKELQQKIDAIDGGKQARWVRTMLISLGGGDPVALTKLQALESQIVATGIRPQIAALQAKLQ